MIIKDAILAGADEIDRGKNWPFDRAKYLNASEADRCIRQQWYEKNGTEGEEQDWGFARRGTSRSWKSPWPWSTRSSIGRTVSASPAS